MTGNIAVLLIEHRHGVNTYVCADEATAKQQLADYVDEYWEQENLDDDGPKPEDVDELIAAYFDRVEDESYILTVETIIVGEQRGFRVEIDGEYGINDGSIHLFNGDDEVVMWDSAEWVEDPSLVYVIANAIDMGHRQGHLASPPHPTNTEG